mgnify:CR=1 FL=1
MQPEKKSLVPMVNFMNKIPGGIMLIPLLVGCTLNSFFPDFLQIGGATTGVLTSTNAFLGAFFVCVGANLSISGAGKALKVGAVVTLQPLTDCGCKLWRGPRHRLMHAGEYENPTAMAVCDERGFTHGQTSAQTFGGGSTRPIAFPAVCRIPEASGA